MARGAYRGSRPGATLAEAAFLALCISGAASDYVVPITEEGPDLPFIVKDSERLLSDACCGDLGCFPIDDDFWHWLYRPVNLAPDCRIRARIRMFLNTRQNPVIPQLLDVCDSVATIAPSFFRPNRPTKIHIHGYVDSYERPWHQLVADEFLREADYNVIRVDWEFANRPPYAQAAANARVVGALVAKFINHLVEEYNADIEDFPIIGHSLGSHTAGYAGTVLRTQYGKTLYRITGLSPAGPFFENMPESVRLDPTDARFVHTIVTDGEKVSDLGLGASQSMGHLNMYPNGGVRQPGCLQVGRGNIHDQFTATAICSHLRSLAFFAESINVNASCSWKTYRCDSQEDFVDGKCFTCKNNECTTVGYHIDSSLAVAGQEKKFYTITGDQSLFCTKVYRLVFTLQNTTKDNNAKKQRGSVFVRLHGTTGSTREILLTPEPGLGTRQHLHVHVWAKQRPGNHSFPDVIVGPSTKRHQAPLPPLPRKGSPHRAIRARYRVPSHPHRPQRKAGSTCYPCHILPAVNLVGKNPPLPFCRSFNETQIGKRTVKNT